MRNILIVFSTAALLLGLVSCTLDDPVGAPMPPPQGAISSPSEHGTYQPLQLPANNGLKKAVTVTANITAAQGGQLAFEHSEGQFSVKIVLNFGPGAVAQDIELKMQTDDQVLAARFGPDGTKFLTPGELYVEAHGLNLASLPDPATLAQRLRLLYQNETTGEWEPIEASGFSVDVQGGTVVCQKGIIRHFSRYGFGI